MINLVQFIDDTNNARKYISGITKINDDEIYDNTLWYKISDEVYIFLKDRLTTKNGNKSSFFIDINSETIDDVSDIKTDSSNNIIEDTLMSVLTQYDKNMQEVLVSISHMYPFKLYKYFNHYNALVAKGIFVTDENQEEKYFDVINTGDDDLVIKFSEFIDIKNDMNDEYTIYKDYNTYHRRLYLSKTKQEAKQVYEEFMSLYK